MNIFDLQATISLNGDAFMSGVSEAQSAFQNLGGAVSTKAVAIGTAVGNMATKAAGSIVDFGKDSINTGMAFETGMSQIAATLGLTVSDIENNVNGAGDTFDALKAKAAEMGRETNFTASQAAEGLNILAMSGFDAESSIAMIGDVLHLAAAGSMEMGSAAGYISGAMKGFADETKDSGYYADLMAKGATLANTSVSQLGEAMSSGAAGAAAYSQNAESMTVALLRLAEQGVVGSAAGTALAASMKDIYTPTDQAAKALAELGVSAYENGKALDFNDIVNKLSDALSGFSEEEANAYKQTIFGIQGLNAFNKMTVTSVERQGEWAEALSSASDGIGEAAKQYDTMTSNLQGARDMMGSALEGLQNAVYEKLAGPLTKATKVATDALGEITKGFEEGGIRGAIESLGSFAKDKLVGIWDNLKLPPELEAASGVIGRIVDAVKPFASAFTDSLKDSISGVASGLGDFVSAISGEAFGIISSLADPIKNLLGAFIENAGTRISTAASAIGAFIDAFRDSSIASTLSSMAGYVVEFIAAFTDRAADIIRGIAGAVSDFMDGFLASDAVGAIVGAGEAVGDFLKTFTESIGDVILKAAGAVSDFLSNFKAGEVGGIIGNIAANVADLFSAIVTTTADVISHIASAIGNLIDTFKDSGAADSIGEVAKKVAELFGSFTEHLAGIIGLIGEKFGDLIDWIAEFASSAAADIPGIMDTIGGALESLGQMFDAIWDALEPLIDALFEALPSVIEGVWDIAVQSTQFFFDIIKDLADFVTSVLTGNFEGAANAIKAAWDDITGFFEGIWESIKNIFSGVGSAFEEIGSNIVQGLKDGINKAWESFTGWVGGLMDGLTSKVKGIFGEHSPSKVFAGIGLNLVAGMEQGWESEFPSLENTVADSLSGLTGTARIGFDSSAIGKSSAAGITSMLTASNGAGNTGTVEINLVLDGDVAATALYDPLRRVAWQKGMREAVYA